MNDSDIDRAAEAIHGVIRTNPSPWAELPEQWRGIYIDAASAALSSVDPGEAVRLLAQVREIMDEVEAQVEALAVHGAGVAAAAKCATHLRIVALFAAVDG